MDTNWEKNEGISIYNKNKTRMKGFMVHIMKRELTESYINIIRKIIRIELTKLLVSYKWSRIKFTLRIFKIFSFNLVFVYCSHHWSHPILPVKGVDLNINIPGHFTQSGRFLGKGGEMSLLLLLRIKNLNSHNFFYYVFSYMG